MVWLFFSASEEFESSHGKGLVASHASDESHQPIQIDLPEGFKPRTISGPSSQELANLLCDGKWVVVRESATELSPIAMEFVPHANIKIKETRDGTWSFGANRVTFAPSMSVASQVNDTSLHVWGAEPWHASAKKESSIQTARIPEVLVAKVPSRLVATVPSVYIDTP